MDEMDQEEVKEAVKKLLEVINLLNSDPFAEYRVRDIIKSLAEATGLKFPQNTPHLLLAIEHNDEMTPEWDWS